MTTLTSFQNTQAEAFWTLLEDANEARGSLTAALQDRLGILGDYLSRYFEQDENVKVALGTLVMVADKLSQDFTALCSEMQNDNFFDVVDFKVKAEGGDQEDAYAVQNMIAEQHWMALTAELRYLAQANDNNEAIEAQADLMDAGAKYFHSALYSV